ncbi:MAG: stage II sporulation protein R [Ruminococcus sp.]|nr:stage II sporulation protein R [Ruminococcus sp.]
MKTKRILIIEAAAVLGLIITVFITGITSFAEDYQNITDNVLRLHILANSDSDSDQALKLKVRDEILNKTSYIFENTGDINEAKSAAVSALPEIQRIAEETMKANGYDYPVAVKLTKMNFDTRVYGEITMPAGEYEAIRVTIGEADGQNWWCVMFPPLCIPAVTVDTSTDDASTDTSTDDTPTDETEDKAIEVFNGVLDESEEDILVNPDKYEARFFIIDLINGIKEDNE